MIEIFFLGNVDTKRVEAELVIQNDGNEKAIAIVFNTGSEMMVEVINSRLAEELRNEFNEAIARAKSSIKVYPNRVGNNPPFGLTKAGLSLWLLTKTDGTAFSSSAD